MAELWREFHRDHTMEWWEKNGEAAAKAWNEKYKWHLKYKPSNRGWEIGSVIVERWMNSFKTRTEILPRSAIKTMIDIWTAASLGCWDAVEHYQKRFEGEYNAFIIEEQKCLKA